MDKQASVVVTSSDVLVALKPRDDAKAESILRWRPPGPPMPATCVVVAWRDVLVPKMSMSRWKALRRPDTSYTHQTQP
tara:strand:+ start:107 stop:340 length:234 start_codon:yes stop_codon:yes gene_type:complete